MIKTKRQSLILGIMLVGLCRAQADPLLEEMTENTYAIESTASGGPVTHHVAHSTGIYAVVAGAIIAMIGFVLRIIYSVFHP